MLKEISWMWVNLEKSVGGKWGRTWRDFKPVTPTFSLEWAMKVTCQTERREGNRSLVFRKSCHGSTSLQPGRKEPVVQRH